MRAPPTPSTALDRLLPASWKPAWPVKLDRASPAPLTAPPTRSAVFLITSGACTERALSTLQHLSAISAINLCNLAATCGGAAGALRCVCVCGGTHNFRGALDDASHSLAGALKHLAPALVRVVDDLGRCDERVGRSGAKVLGQVRPGSRPETLRCSEPAHISARTRSRGSGGGPRGVHASGSGGMGEHGNRARVWGGTRIRLGHWLGPRQRARGGRRVQHSLICRAVAVRELG